MVSIRFDSVWKRYGEVEAVELTERWMSALRRAAYLASVALAKEKGAVFLLALVDFALYRRLPEVIICYRCKAQHRRCGAQAQVESFDLLTAEVIDNQIREQEEENHPAGA